MNDREWAETYSGLSAGDHRLLQALRDHDPSDDDTDREAEADYYSERFQHPDGPEEYTVTVAWSGGTRTEARLLADLIRDVVRRNEERVNCPVCKGSRWVGGPFRPGAPRRCTACKDGTVLAGPAAVVTFESPGEVGSEATPYVPADHVARMLAESRRRHPANRS